jgi:hypothetical protein
MPQATGATAGSLPPAARPASTNDQNSKARRYAQESSEEEIWQTSRQYMMAPHFAYPPGQPIVWVKFGQLDRLAEANMQRLAWQWVRSERMAGRCSNIHVPEVLRVFTSNQRAFIIMELLDATVLSKSVFARPMGSLHPVQ